MEDEKDAKFRDRRESEDAYNSRGVFAFHIRDNKPGDKMSLTKNELSFIYWGFTSAVCAVLMTGFLGKWDPIFSIFFLVLFLISFYFFGLDYKEAEKEARR